MLVSQRALFSGGPRSPVLLTPCQLLGSHAVVRCAGAQTETELQALRLFTGTFGYCLLGMSRMLAQFTSVSIRNLLFDSRAACRRDCIIAALHRCGKRARQASRALLVRVGLS